MTLTEWIFKDPAQAAVTTATIGGALVGSLGWLITKVVDPEKSARLYQFGKVLSGLGISVPVAVIRTIALVKGTKPSEQPTPPEGKISDGSS